MDVISPLLEWDSAADNQPLDGEIQRYFESPHLLDEFLEELVRKLTKIYLVDRNLQWPLNSLYILSNVRGFKQVSTYLDTEPLLLQKTLDNLTDTTISWRSRYILLLWVANLLLVPFQLDALGDGLFDRIFGLCTTYLVLSSKERDAAALVMARLLSRSNLQANTRVFLDWQAKRTPKIGVLQVLAYLCRFKVWYPREFLELTDGVQGNSELKLAIKIRTRISLVLPTSQETEATINFLFDLVASTSSDIRYSSAKALARICAKLKHIGHTEIANQIIGEILNGFQDDQLKGRDRLSVVSDDKWHGSLLFIAELIRQKVTVNTQTLLLFLNDALHFEQKRLNYSVGANVRDAACYVCWSLFKSTTTLGPDFLKIVYESLVGLACFDREVNIRRAAAAALQEGLGRHHGMETVKALKLIQLINFQSVGQTPNCYLVLAPAADPRPQLRYLIQHGVCSWDVNIRRLAAKSLKKFPNPPIELLLDLFTTPDQDTKHGVLCALGSVYKGLPREKLTPILDYKFDFTSEIVCEGFLAFLKCVSSPTMYMDQCMWSSSDIVLERVDDLVRDFNDAQAREVFPTWLERAEQSAAYVAAIAACKRDSLLQLSKVTDPKSRKIVIENLDRSPLAEEAVYEALQDYQHDARGDVGSWVRAAALKRVKEWEMVNDKTVKSLWRMASESLGQLRLLSCECLEMSGTVFDKSTHAAYFNSVYAQGDPLITCSGAVVCIGGGTGNQQAAEGALYALLYNLSSMAEPMLSLGWKGELGLCTLRTVLMTLELGYSDAYNHKQLLRLGYNATTNTRETSRIIHGIGILGFIDDSKSGVSGKAIERLVSLCAHPFSPVRVRAAETLFENGHSPNVLIETSWGDQGYLKPQEELKNNIIFPQSSEV